MASNGQKTVLFLCTGNYYRSRFAEHFFNALALQEDLGWQADSRGLAVGRFGTNIGPMSQTALRMLRELCVVVPEPLRMPLQVTEDDLRQADHIVAVKETEHRPLFQGLHAAWTEQVEFWHVHDLDFATPAVALPHLQQEVLALVGRLRSPPIRRQVSLYADPYFTFRFRDDRIIPRFHLEGVPPGRLVRVHAADPATLQPVRLLATALVGEGGWVDLPQAIAVRAGAVFVVFPEPTSNERMV